MASGKVQETNKTKDQLVNIPTAVGTIAVGMSGGVDSSVAALLLKQQGYNVIGLFMKNWEETNPDGSCTAAQDYEDVARVCEKLDIPYYSFDFVKEYREQVFNQFLEDYKKGHTPNPDILCNREIKFNVFFKKALSLGADTLATGHYAGIDYSSETARLVKAKDLNKDQTYFLYSVPTTVFRSVVFPLANLTKSEVREIAREYGLATHNKKDSTGICFIGERDFTKFLSQYVAAKPGPFCHLNGKVVGQHQGVAYYTMGQRRGLGLGGEGECWYVVGKDVERNIVYVERGDNHPALYSDWLTATEPFWISGKPPFLPNESFQCKAKIRYRQADQDCTIVSDGEGRLRVDFDQPQRAITPRQSIVFYDGDCCLGGAFIEKAGPSYFEQGRPINAATHDDETK